MLTFARLLARSLALGCWVAWLAAGVPGKLYRYCKRAVTIVNDATGEGSVCHIISGTSAVHCSAVRFCLFLVGSGWV